MKIIFPLILLAIALPCRAEDNDGLTPKEEKEAARQSQVVANAFGLAPATQTASDLNIYKGTTGQDKVCYVSVKVEPQDYELALLDCQPDTAGKFRCMGETKLQYIRTEKRTVDATVEWGSTARKQRLLGDATILWNKYKTIQRSPIFKKYQDGREKTMRIHTKDDGSIALSIHYHSKEGESGLFASNVRVYDGDGICKGMRPMPYAKADLEIDTFGIVPHGTLKKDFYDAWRREHPTNSDFGAGEPETKGETSAR